MLCRGEGEAFEMARDYLIVGCFAVIGVSYKAARPLSFLFFMMSGFWGTITKQRLILQEMI